MLPVVAEEAEEDGCREEVTDATLTFVDSMTWRLEVAERETCGDTVEEETEAEEGTYTTEGDALRFAESDDEPDEVDDDEVDDDEADTELDLDDLGPGTLNADGLTIRLEGGRIALFRSQAG